jgi:hypothetical protein
MKGSHLARFAGERHIGVEKRRDGLQYERATPNSAVRGLELLCAQRPTHPVLFGHKQEGVRSRRDGPTLDDLLSATTLA